MRPILDQWTIVAPGAWNARIFSAAWVSERVFKSDKVTIEMTIGGLGPLRYNGDGIHLVASDDMVVLGVRSADADALSRAEEAAIRIFEGLPETPVAA